ncbi:MAG: aminotransferase, partial [Bacteroidota bacterium]
YNRDFDADFNKLCRTIDNAKMIEVSATTLPQRAIPSVMQDERYKRFLANVNEKIGQRSRLLYELFADLAGIQFNETHGAFYNTIIFKKGVLHDRQHLKTDDPAIDELLEKWITPEIPLDQRFVYYLLAVKRVCVVPISAFASELLGFRMTLLEEDENEQKLIYGRIREGLIEYLNS